jgi:hypothetical protein
MVPPPPTANGRVSRGASRTAVVRCPATDRESGPAPNRSLQFCLSQRILCPPLTESRGLMSMRFSHLI